VYRGFYLNLARNEERRAALTRHLQEVGASSRYERFEAIEGRSVASQYFTPLDPGALGLWLTHEKLVHSQRSPQAHLHIIEDDAIFARNAVSQFDVILQAADTWPAGWDILFTDVFVPPDWSEFQSFSTPLSVFATSRNYSVVDLVSIDFAATSSLFLNRACVDKYAALIAGQWSLGLPIDLHIRKLVHEKQLKAYAIVPFLTSVSPESLRSDIRGTVDRSRKACELYRRAFFVEADHPALLREMQDLTQGLTHSPLASLYVQLMAFMVSDQFKGF
jgi:hypothetical protein